MNGELSLFPEDTQGQPKTYFVLQSKAKENRCLAAKRGAVDGDQVFLEAGTWTGRLITSQPPSQGL